MAGFGSVSVTSLGGSGRKDGGSERCAVLPKWTHITLHMVSGQRGGCHGAFLFPLLPFLYLICINH